MSILQKLRIGYWNIGIIENDIESIMEGKDYSIRWMKHHYRDRFYADPFIYGSDERYYYILVEELIFVRDKGTISLLTIDKKNMNLVDQKVIIDDEFHLSYPYYDGESIVPENYKSGALYKFYFDGRKEKVLDVPLIDPTFVEYAGKKWLFGTTKEEPEDAKKKLSIFYEKDGVYYPHNNNPVKNDICTSRPGGSFFEYKGDLYRPAQNSENIYGEDIRIMKIIALDEDEFKEEQVKIIESHRCKKYNLGLHTFNVGDGFIVVDGFQYSNQFVEKVKLKLKHIR